MLFDDVATYEGRDPNDYKVMRYGIYGTPTTVTGFRLVDARASYGFGLETFLLGYPMHFDWSWRTLFNTAYEDIVYASSGGSASFRKPKFTFWIGYDW